MREEEGRLQERLYKFGEDGLKKLEHELNEAIQKNMVRFSWVACTCRYDSGFLLMSFHVF